jgi:hypothetical protein
MVRSRLRGSMSTGIHLRVSPGGVALRGGRSGLGNRRSAAMAAGESFKVVQYQVLIVCGVRILFQEKSMRTFAVSCIRLRLPLAVTLSAFACAPAPLAAQAASASEDMQALVQEVKELKEASRRGGGQAGGSAARTLTGDRYTRGYRSATGQANGRVTTACH